MHGLLKINDELFTIKRITNLQCESLASKWNNISPKYKTFKKNERLYFCELVEELIPIEEDLETPIN